MAGYPGGREMKALFIGGPKDGEVMYVERRQNISVARLSKPVLYCAPPKPPSLLRRLWNWLLGKKPVSCDLPITISTTRYNLEYWQFPNCRRIPFYVHEYLDPQSEEVRIRVIAYVAEHEDEFTCPAVWKEESKSDQKRV